MLQGYQGDDKSKIKSTLKKLLKHINRAELTFVGGIAIDHHTFTSKTGSKERSAADIDCVVDSIDSIKSSITKDFMIYHHHIHNKEARDRFYISLVDSATKINVRIFDAKAFAPYKKTSGVWGLQDKH